MIHIRRAGAMDAARIADLLNEVIAAGGTTALTRAVSGDQIAGWIACDPRAIWHLAEDEGGQLVGFQWVEPYTEIGPEVAQIATFARIGRTGLGIGSRLFEQTRALARLAGYVWINAEIRADNSGGLAYYQSRGFEDWGRRSGVLLEDGTIVDKVLKRFDL